MNTIFRSWLLLAVAATLLLSACEDKRARNRATLSMNHAIQSYELGNYSGAIYKLEEAIAHDPTWGDPHYYLGMIRLMRFHSPASAIPDLQRAIELMPDHAQSHYLLGSAFLEEGDRAAARAELDTAIEPGHARALFRLGNLHETNGHVMDAVDAYMRAIRADPRFPNGYARLGRIYALYEAIPEALAVFDEGYEHTQEPTLANDLGRMHMIQGDTAAAISFFERALQVDPTSVGYNYNIGLAYVASFVNTGDPRDRARAEEHLETAENRCNSLGSQARCNSIRRATEELEETVSANE